MGSYKRIENGGIELLQGGATMMACPNPELEAAFFEALKQVKSYRTEGDNLFLDETVSIQKRLDVPQKPRVKFSFFVMIFPALIVNFAI